MRILFPTDEIMFDDNVHNVHSTSALSLVWELRRSEIRVFNCIPADIERNRNSIVLFG